MIRILYPIIIAFLFVICFYLFKVIVAKIRLNKMDIVIENHDNFYLLLPIISIYIISQIYLKKNKGELKTTISAKTMFIRFNDTMDLITVLTLVLIEKGEINPYKRSGRSVLNKIKENLTVFLNSGNYGYA